MLAEWYARRMFAWETALTTRDENRIVRPLEWGFDWLEDWPSGRTRLRRMAGQAVGTLPLVGVQFDRAGKMQVPDESNWQSGTRL
jgi:glycine cleavage system aminomethyltransferase T